MSKQAFGRDDRRSLFSYILLKQPKLNDSPQLTLTYCGVKIFFNETNPPTEVIVKNILNEKYFIINSLNDYELKYFDKISKYGDFNYAEIKKELEAHPPKEFDRELEESIKEIKILFTPLNIKTASSSRTVSNPELPISSSSQYKKRSLPAIPTKQSPKKSSEKLEERLQSLQYLNAKNDEQMIKVKKEIEEDNTTMCDIIIPSIIKVMVKDKKYQSEYKRLEMESNQEIESCNSESIKELLKIEHDLAFNQSLLLSLLISQTDGLKLTLRASEEEFKMKLDKRVKEWKTVFESYEFYIEKRKESGLTPYYYFSEDKIDKNTEIQDKNLSSLEKEDLINSLKTLAKVVSECFKVIISKFPALSDTPNPTTTLEEGSKKINTSSLSK